MAGFWLLYGADRYMQRLWFDYLATNARPPVLNGLQVPFGDFVQPSPPQLNAGSLRLIIVSSDSCRYSDAAIGSWVDLIDSIQLQSGDDILFISTQGREIYSRLVAKVDPLKAEYVRLAAVRNQAVFAQTTGISWTPEVLGVDDSGHVRLATEEINDRAGELFRQFFGRSHAANLTNRGEGGSR